MVRVKKTAKIQPLEAFSKIAVDLTRDLSSESRYERLLAAVKEVVPAEAVALLRLEEGVLVPLAVDGLAPEVMGHRFLPSEHPRLQAILNSPDPIEFAPDSPLPDPYDGLLECIEELEIHSCLGACLRLDGKAIGVLTLDAPESGRFSGVDLRVLAAFAALSAALLHTAGLIEALEEKTRHTGQVARHLVASALNRGVGELLGISQPMIQLRNDLEIVAQSDLTVLIMGETGTGKELVARTLHAHSTRKEEPLVYVNCAALTETLAESELFGHTKGSFTGAVADRLGKFELSDGGTLLLDEVGELPLSIQSSLLRAIQFGEIQRVGSDQTKIVNARIIAATNRDLVEEVRKGRFRADLFHRLSVYPVRVPALRERGKDIQLLAGAFLDLARQRFGGKAFRFTEEALQLLREYSWPGNVRELEHVVVRAALRAAQHSKVTRGVVRWIEADGLEFLVASPESRELPEQDIEARQAPVARELKSLKKATAEFQKQYIGQAVQDSGGNWAKAAKFLRMDRGNLSRKAKKLGITALEGGAK